MVEFLLRHGADPLLKITSPVIHQVIKDYANDDGATFALIWRWMVERKKTAAHLDTAGNTALHVAAKKGVVGALNTMLRTCVCKTG